VLDKDMQKSFRSGVRLARSATRLGGRRHRVSRSKSVMPPGAHIETFSEAIRWGQPFLDWGRPWRWLKNLASWPKEASQPADN
jgi:hypothetical protein